MDFFVWVYMQSIVSKVPRRNLVALRTSLLKGWDETPEDMVCGVAGKIENQAGGQGQGQRIKAVKATTALDLS